MDKREALRPVRFFVGLISNEFSAMEAVKKSLIKRFGPLSRESELLDFGFTTYYDKEMGTGLKRKFLIFENLIPIEHIEATKLFTNRLEKRYSKQGKRRINIDPGYVSLGKIVLLTTKDYYHRIYLGRGIYAEVTLYYKDETFHSFEWSYPDYRSKGYIEFFNSVRADYVAQLKREAV